MPLRRKSRISPFSARGSCVEGLNPAGDRHYHRMSRIRAWRWRCGTTVLACLALIGFGDAVAASPSGTQSGAGAPSVLEIPLDIDLGAVFRQAESLLPREAGHWRNWRREHGIETRYRAWRGPLALHLQGDVLSVQAHVRYWVQGRKRIIGGLDLKVGCGVDEPPRQALVGVLVRLAWGPDWTLRPTFRVLPTRFIDRCEVTIADIDVSPVIGQMFRKRMEDSLTAALAQLRPRIEEARRRAAEYWGVLQRPMELMPGVWLSADPAAIALAPPFGAGQHLKTVLGIALSPRIEIEAPSAPAPRPLPPLGTFFPRSSGMRLDLKLSVELDRFAAHLSADLARRVLTVQGRRIGIGSVTLRGEGKELVVGAEITGEAPGHLEIFATPAFDAESQRLMLTGLDFVYDPEDPDLGLLANLFYQRIQAALEEGANGLLADYSERLQHRLAAALSRSLPEGVDLDISALRLQRLEIAVGYDAIRLLGSAAGSVNLSLR